MVWLMNLFAFGVCPMDDTVHIPYVVDRLDEIIDLYETEDDSLSAVEELRRELIFNMGVNSLARHKDQDQKILDGSYVPPVIKLRGVPDDD
jgi:hypothetical protein